MVPLDLDARSRAVTPLAPGMDTRLYPYQQAAVEQHLRGWRLHSLLAHHPGAGKTPMAIALGAMAVALGDSMTVICPPSICDQWATRIAEWMNGEAAVVCRTGAQVKTHARARVAIVPDSMLHLITEAPPDGRVVVIDEVHRFKERRARRTRALFGRRGDARFPGLTNNAQTIIALTGTPVISSPADLFPLLRAMGFEDARGSFEAYCDHYCPPYPVRIRTAKGIYSELKYDKPINLPELANKLRRTFLIRPKREDYLNQLPPLRFEDFRLNVTDTSDPMVLALDPQAVAEGEGSDSIAALRKQVGMQKAYAARDILQDIIDGGDRPVIFAWHREVVEQIANGHNLAYVHGGVNNRDAVIERFALGDYKGIVLSIAACGTGLDGLQRISDSVMFMEESFCPHENEQAIARVHRTGQVNPVRVLRFRSDTVIDRAVAAAAVRKTANAEGTLQ